MRVRLVTSSFLPTPGALERHADRLARGLARCGVEVEVLTQAPVRRPQRGVWADGVVVHRFPSALGPVRFGIAPKLWEWVRDTSRAFDLVDVHTRQARLALAVDRSGAPPMVFTPRAPIQRFLDWPHIHAMRILTSRCAQIVCSSQAERDLLCRKFPLASGKTHVLPDGVDAAMIQGARPFAPNGTIVLVVGRLEPMNRVDRAIGAMAGLAPGYRLVVVGDGPARDRLRAHATDLRIAARVDFLSAVTDATLCRWLRTAHVALALADQDSSGSQVTEALAAGASVVASDIPVHREVAARLDSGRVLFVSPNGSPLEVADAVVQAARTGGSDARALTPSLPRWDSLVNATAELYNRVISDDPRLPETSDPQAFVQASG